MLKISINKNLSFWSSQIFGCRKEENHECEVLAPIESRSGPTLERVQWVHVPTDFWHCNELHPQNEEVENLNLTEDAYNFF